MHKMTSSLNGGLA